MRRTLVSVLTAVAALAACGTAAAHLLDHAVPTGSEPAPLSTAFNSGGQNAQWELVDSIPTGNPHTDLDSRSSARTRIRSTATASTSTASRSSTCPRA